MSDDEREKYPSETAERFQVRLPPGLRDRIKAYAEQHGRSMNSEIVRVLEREYPAPYPLAERIAGLLTLSRKMRDVLEGDAIDEIGGTLLDIVKGIANGTVAGVDDETRQNVADWLYEWEQETAEGSEGYRESFDEEELVTYQRTGSTAKVVDLPDDKK